jgi:C1A family cysteine protease
VTRGAYGRLPKTPDARDYRFRAPRRYTGAFVDLTDGFPEPPYDQGQLGSCVSNGTAAILDYARAKQGLPPLKRPSRLFVYYNGRVRGGYPIGEDTGLEVRDGLAVVSKDGAPPEDADWPYDVARFTDKPPAQAYLDGVKDVAVKFGAVDQGDIDATIASGYPLVFGFSVRESFEGDELARTGIMPVPQPGEQEVGGHCVVVVSTAIDGREIGGIAGKRYRKVRNSWGTDWGQGGYFWMPVEVMDSADASDFWVLTTVSDPHGPTPPNPPEPPNPPRPWSLLLALWQATRRLWLSLWATITGRRSE